MGIVKMAGKEMPELTELPPTISVEQAAKLLGVSRSAAYRAAAKGDHLERASRLALARVPRVVGVSGSATYRAASSGQLLTLAFGRRLRVPTAPLLRMLGWPVEED